MNSVAYDISQWILTVVVTSLKPLLHNMCIKAEPVNSPPLSCIQCDDWRYHVNQLLLNNVSMCTWFITNTNDFRKICFLYQSMWMLGKKTLEGHRSLSWST